MANRTPDAGGREGSGALPTPRTDIDLVRAYAETRAEEAVAELIARHGPMVFAVAQRILGDRQSAEDAAQATFLLFCRKAAGLGRLASPRAWLYEAARLTAMGLKRDWAVQRRHEREAARRISMESTPETPRDLAFASRLDEAIGHLPERLRNAIVLRYLGGLSEPDAARELGCTRSAISMRLARGLDRMKRWFARRGAAVTGAALLAALERVEASPMAPDLPARILDVCSGRLAVPPAVAARLPGVARELFWTDAKLAVAAVAAALLAVALLIAPTARGPADGIEDLPPPPGAAGVETAAVVTAGPAPRIAHDWPMYIGPGGTFADAAPVPLLEDFTQARLCWKSEDKSLGWGKTMSSEGATTKRAPGLYPSGQGSLIVAGGLVIAGYYIPSGDVILKAAEGCAPEFRQRALISADDVILAVDAATGKTRWKQVFAGKGFCRSHGKRPTYGTTPAAAAGRVFHLGTTGRVYGVEQATGRPIWESDIGEWHQGLEALKARVLQARSVAKEDVPFTMITSLVVFDDVLGVPAGTKAIGFDAADGKKLWEIPDALSGSNVPCPATVEGQAFFFCVNAKGEMRLVRTKSGEALWTRKLGNGISHSTQPVVARAEAFLFEPIASDAPAKDGVSMLGVPACYELSLSGARKRWMLPAEFKHGMRFDGGPSAKIGYRDGVAYFGTLDMSTVVAVKAEDGSILGKLSPANWGHFHLWGDRLVLIGDNSHESLARSCTYTPYTIPDLKPAGNGYAPRGGQGVSGYVLPIRDPFADGYQFMRTAAGEIWCYELRKPEGRP